MMEQTRGSKEGEFFKPNETGVILDLKIRNMQNEIEAIGREARRMNVRDNNRKQ